MADKQDIGITDVDDILTVIEETDYSIYKKIIVIFIISLMSSLLFTTEITNLDVYPRVLCNTIIPTVLASVYLFYTD
jgi:hypothetical protein